MPNREPKYCIVPAWFQYEDIQRHTCHDRSHFHVRLAEAQDLLRVGAAEWVSRRAGVLRLKRSFKLRDISGTLGAYLTVKLARREGWAQVMAAAILRWRDKSEEGNAGAA